MPFDGHQPSQSAERRHACVPTMPVTCLLPLLRLPLLSSKCCAAVHSALTSAASEGSTSTSVSVKSLNGRQLGGWGGEVGWGGEGRESTMSHRKQQSQQQPTAAMPDIL